MLYLSRYVELQQDLPLEERLLATGIASAIAFAVCGVMHIYDKIKEKRKRKKELDKDRDQR